MPTRAQAHRVRLAPLLGQPSALEAYLLRGSGLPGRRANLALAAALADVLEANAPQPALFAVLLEWLELGPDRAPTNSRREYLPFCALQALAACCSGGGAEREAAFGEQVHRAVHDPRWRMRDGACLALQRLGERDPAALLRLLAGFCPERSRLERRAMLVALAHPPLLGEPAVVELALQLAEGGLRELAAFSAEELAEETARVLQESLAFAPSVVVAADPLLGFDRLRRWAAMESLVVRKIVAANLRKARLARHFPDEVEEVGLVLSWVD